MARCHGLYTEAGSLLWACGIHTPAPGRCTSQIMTKCPRRKYGPGELTQTDSTGGKLFPITTAHMQKCKLACFEIRRPMRFFSRGKPSTFLNTGCQYVASVVSPAQIYPAFWL